jgi:hypothetical protein
MWVEFKASFAGARFVIRRGDVCEVYGPEKDALLKKKYAIPYDGYIDVGNTLVPVRNGEIVPEKDREKEPGFEPASPPSATEKAKEEAPATNGKPKPKKNK